VIGDGETMRIDGKRKPVNVLIVGVGGQGVLLASEVLAEAASSAGFDVKKSEVHGMAQRGGSVISHLRYGRTVHSPLISRGRADILVSFEKLETLLYLDYLHRDSWALVNDQEINPLPVGTGKALYPAGIVKLLGREGVQCKMIDGHGLAERAGNPRTVNSVILGVLSKFLTFGLDTWRDALGRHVPERYRDVNITAFDLGRRRHIRFE